MSATTTYNCERCPVDAKPLRAKADDVLALLRLCPEHQAERHRKGLADQKKITPQQAATKQPGAKHASR
jgi:hypothetical protein